MRANEYEYLLSKIYFNGMLYKTGFNADIYVKMQKEYNNLKATEALVNSAKSEYVYRKSFFIVRNFIQQAIKDGIKNFQFNMALHDVDQLSNMIAFLDRDFFDKKTLDQIITKASTVFNHYNLKN